MLVAPCLFCDIVAGEASAAIVLRTPGVVAFLDVRPVFKGHVLVVPRDHVVTLTDLPTPMIEPLVGAAQQVAGALVATLGAQGSFVAVNNAVSQSVPHLHIHVVPRTRGDGLRGFFWPRQRYEDGEMTQYADRLRPALRPGRSAAP